MIFVTYVLAGLFVAFSIAMVFVFSRERHFGILLLGITYGISGLLAIMLSHWWPLAAGFVLAWLLKLLGLEPDRGPGCQPCLERREVERGTQVAGGGQHHPRHGARSQGDDLDAGR